jgi:hypothetical protein
MAFHYVRALKGGPVTRPTIKKEGELNGPRASSGPDLWVGKQTCCQHIFVLEQIEVKQIEEI